MSNSSGSDSYDSPVERQVASQSGNDERGTPPELLRTLIDALPSERFSVDPASGAEPFPIADTRYTEADNGLQQSWDGDSVWLNPPYSDLKTWLKKAVREIDRTDSHAPELLLALLPGNTSTQWFQEYAAQATYMTLIEGRLEFHGTDGSAPFASLLACFGEPNDDLMAAFDQLGTVYSKADIQRAADATSQSRLDDLTASDGGAIAAPASQTAATAAGPTARDLTPGQPATAGLAVTDMGPGATLYLELESGTMQTIDAPTAMTVEVLAGAPAATPGSQTPDRFDSVLAIHQPSETYVCLYQDPDNIADIKASIAPNGVGWQDVYLTTIHRQQDAAPWSVCDYHGGLWVNGAHG